jgi:hypothetical protein
MEVQSISLRHEEDGTHKIEGEEPRAFAFVARLTTGVLCWEPNALEDLVPFWPR